ncbi:DUF6089 family protein [Flavobacteriaceae bacterium]|nr:DUF6089 family protein [Flavobacteriaceae bacterium]
MKPVYILLVLLLTYNLSDAQIYEIGVFGGGSNFVGDVGATTFIAPNALSFGGILKWNRSTRHSLRASFIYSKLAADDTASDDPRRKLRGYNFNSSLFEVSAGMEFTFFEFDLHTGTPQATPYIYTGISMANFPNFYYSGGRLVSEKTRSNAYGIPIALGFKVSVAPHIVLGFEIAAHYTFSDELDGSVPDTENLRERFRFGNFNNNDWYVFSGFTLTYTFGRKPCFCNY